MYYVVEHKSQVAYMTVFNWVKGRRRFIVTDVVKALAIVPYVTPVGVRVLAVAAMKMDVRMAPEGPNRQTGPK